MFIYSNCSAFYSYKLTEPKVWKHETAKSIVEAEGPFGEWLDHLIREAVGNRAEKKKM